MLVIIIVLVAILGFNLNNISMPGEDNSMDVNNSTDVIDNQKSNVSLVADDINMTMGEDVNYTVQLIDSEGDPVPLKGEKVKIIFKDKTYDRKTNEKGIATLPINLDAGNYTFTAQYNGNEITNDIIVNSV